MKMYLKMQGLPNKHFTSAGVSFITLDGDQDRGYNFVKGEHRCSKIRQTCSYIKGDCLHVWLSRTNRTFNFPILEIYETEEEYLKEISKYSVMKELVS